MAAIAATDRDGIQSELASEARFRYLVPPGPGEITGAAAVAAKLHGWFADADVLHVQSVRVETLADRTSVQYRFLLHEGEEWEVVEQQMYVDTDGDGRIASIDLICSGFRPTEGPDGARSSDTHRFDAGNRPEGGFRVAMTIPCRTSIEVDDDDAGEVAELPAATRWGGVSA